MYKILFSTSLLICLGVLTACQGEIRAGRPMIQSIRPTTLPTEPRTTRSAEMVSLETPLRCSLEDREEKLATVIPFMQEAFLLSQSAKSDPMPRFEVMGFSFDGMTAEKVFFKLLGEAKIKVIGVDGPFPELSAESIQGELAEVMGMIADAADVYYRYDAQEKTLLVSRETTFDLHVPQKREVMIAVLDSLRGSGLHDLVINWEESIISFKGDKAVEAKVKKLIELFDSEPNLIAFDVRVYRAKPMASAGEIPWQSLVDRFGHERVKFMLRGVMGRALVTENEINAKSVALFLRSHGALTLVSEGMFIAANNWRSRFDVGRCGYISMPEAQLSIMAETEVKPDRRMTTAITLDSDQGEITSFTADSRLGDNILLIGIPSASFSDSLNGYETVVVMTPRIIRLMKGQN